MRLRPCGRSPRVEKGEIISRLSTSPLEDRWRRRRVGSRIERRSFSSFPFHFFSSKERSMVDRVDY